MASILIKEHFKDKNFMDSKATLTSTKLIALENYCVVQYKCIITAMSLKGQFIVTLNQGEEYT